MSVPGAVLFDLLTAASRFMERLECRGRIGEGRAGLAHGVSAAHVRLRRQAAQATGLPPSAAEALEACGLRFRTWRIRH